MKTISKILILIAILQISPVMAQRFKGALITGMSTNQVDGDTQKGYNKLGFLAGVFVETDLNKLFGLKAELYYISKGAKNNIGGVEVFKTKLQYVQMPFLITLKPINRWQFDFGLAGSYLVNSELTEQGYVLDKDQYDMHEFDFSAKVSGMYYFTQKMALNIYFDYSLLPIKNEPNWYNNNLCFAMIYKFK